MSRKNLAALVVVLGMVLIGPQDVVAQTRLAEQPEPLPTIDVSRSQTQAALAAAARVSSRQRDAMQALARAVPGVSVQWNALTGTPERVQSTRSLLTAESVAAPAQVLRSFLGGNAGLFGLSPADLNTLVVARQSEAPGSALLGDVQRVGMLHVALEQRWQGRQIFPANVMGSVTTQGRLASVVGTVVPDLASKVNALEPEIEPLSAISAAAQSIGASFDPDQIQPISEPVGAELRQTFSGGSGFVGNIAARLIYMIASPDEVRLVWEVVLGARQDPFAYHVLVDALDSRILYRETITSEDTPQWRVYFDVHTSPSENAKDDYQPFDSPFPLTPGPATPDGSQGTEVPAETLISNGDPVTSPTGWIEDGVTTTTGNNVSAFVDSNFNGLPDAGEQPTASIVDVSGVMTRVFDFAADFTAAPQTSGNEAAATVQAFVLANWWHDRMERLGFTEAAGNFQDDNGGAGGMGGDPILARLHVGTNNSTFSTPPADGTCCPTLNSFTWTGPDPDRDSGFDDEILIHEFTHGLSNRIIGGPNVNGLSGGGQPGGLGEGYSDIYAFLLLRTPDEDSDGVYVVGGYATFLLPPIFGQPAGWDDNYFFGIRHFPYTTDRCKNPQTLLDMQPATYDITPLPAWNCPNTPPVSPWLATRSGAVHDMGEIWAVTVWEVRRNLVDKHGAAAGNELTLQLVTDSMFNLQARPTFVDARDAILVADLARTGGANRCEIWRGFAKRGLGVGAATPTAGAFTEDFNFPQDCEAKPVEVASSSYAAKLVCGIAKDPEDLRLTPGFYATTINIHNPNEKEARFTKTLALTFPPKEQRPGATKEYAEDSLPPGLALATGCPDIIERVFGGNLPTPYIEGFVIIESTHSLDVTAVYTKTALKPKMGGAIDVEQIVERRMGEAKPAGKPDLRPVGDANGNFCRLSRDGLQVTVRNDGSASAGASETAVDFGALGVHVAPTPMLTPGGVANLVAPLPRGCFNPDCEFRIQADRGGVVDESDEGNNTASGICLG